MKKLGRWAISIICGLFALIGICDAKQAWGMIFFAAPMLLFNPKFREFLNLKHFAVRKSLLAAAVILPLITTVVSAATTSSLTSQSMGQQVASSSQGTSSQVSSKTESSKVSSVSSKIVQTAAAPKAGAKIKIHYIDVGQGDSEFIELPNGQCMLIDAGEPQYGAGVVSYVKGLGHSKIDYIICTHPHADHIGGMTDVINSFNIGSIYMPRTSSSDTPTTKVYRNLLSAIQSKGLSIHTAKAGVNIINSGNLSINLIAPCGTDYHDLNQYSAVMMLQYGNNKFLFTGDAGNVSEDQISANVQADVLKVGHHGSRTATGQKFLNKVHPKYAVIEVGRGNSYGHPTAQTLGRLQSIGATIYRTDSDGTIIFTSDSKTITIDKKASTTKQNAPNKGASTKRSRSAKRRTSGGAYATGGSTHKSSGGASNATNQNQTVYITRTGKCYHTAGCSSLRKSKEAISLADAKARGLKPCSKCHPPE